MNEYFSTAVIPSFAGALKAELNASTKSAVEYYLSKDKPIWVRTIKAAAGRQNVDLFKDCASETALTEVAFRDVEMILAIQTGGQKAVIEGVKMPMDVLMNKRPLIDSQDLLAPPARKTRVSCSTPDPEACKQTEDDIQESLYEIPWDFMSAPPSWFDPAKSAFLTVFDRRDMSNPLYWRIIDLSFPGTLELFSFSDIQVLNKTFATSLESLDNLSTDLEAVLCGLSLLSSPQLVIICKRIQMGGPLAGLEALHQLLGDNGDGESDHDEAEVFFESAETAGSDDAIKILEILQSIIVSVDISKEKFGRMTEDIVYCMNLFKSSYEMIAVGVPNRFNTERDVDVWFLFAMFKCFSQVAAIHYGEPVSRASRDRRQIASVTSEGYHLDYMFTSMHNTSQQGFGHEFSGVERVGSKQNPGNKLQTDSLKLAKTLRDMHVKLRRDIEAACGGFMPKEAANSMQVLRMGGFRTTGFTVQTSVLIYAGGGFFIRKVVNDFAVPTHERDIGKNVVIIKEMMKMKKILSLTVKNFESIKRRSVASNVIGSIRHNYKKEAATPDKRGKKNDVK
ncbi:hypothetical protein BJ741DRAFT_635165 [Chytriomyces cf. hyalinus JEL632]|nr:hypothetical protein BJ741DRAFT_635165 [Chytriomyces cf. hyalinus JEL632]